MSRGRPAHPVSSFFPPAVRLQRWGSQDGFLFKSTIRQRRILKLLPGRNRLCCPTQYARPPHDDRVPQHERQARYADNDEKVVKPQEPSICSFELSPQSTRRPAPIPLESAARSVRGGGKPWCALDPGAPRSELSSGPYCLRHREAKSAFRHDGLAVKRMCGRGLTAATWQRAWGTSANRSPCRSLFQAVSSTNA
jgi:hypothetical protein